MADRENRAELTGMLASEPSFSYESYGTRYFLAPLDVERLSGTADHLNVVLPESLLPLVPERGEALSVLGEVRSFNNKSGVGNRLVITVLAREARAGGEEHENRILLSGVLCKPPILRKTPLGREICDIILAANRRYGRADYIPCIAWGKIARSIAERAVGDALRIEGRLQSRGYRKFVGDRAEDRTAFEVSVAGVEKTFFTQRGQTSSLPPLCK